MTEHKTQGATGFLSQLLREEARLLPRLWGAIQLDPEVYAEIDADPASIPQAIVVVLAAALLAGLGNSSLFLILIGLAGMLFAWLTAAALIWAVATLITGRDVEYARLLRCLGFGYVWAALLVLSFLPFLDVVVKLAAMGLIFYSFVLATRQVLGDPGFRPVQICLIALAIPFLVVLLATR